MKQTKLMLVVLGASLFYQGVAFSVEIERGPDQQFEIQIGTSKVKAGEPSEFLNLNPRAATSKKDPAGFVDASSAPDFVQSEVGKAGATGYVDKSTCDQACRSAGNSAGAKPAAGQKMGGKSPQHKLNKGENNNQIFESMSKVLQSNQTKPIKPNMKMKGIPQRKPQARKQK